MRPFALPAPLPGMLRPIARRRSTRTEHGLQPHRPQRPRGLADLSRHDDVRRPDRRGRSRPHRRFGARGRHQLHRHRRRVHARRVGAHGRASHLERPPSLGAGHQGRQPDDAASQHQRPRPCVDDARARRQPRAPRHRLHRPLLLPPRRRDHADRGVAARGGRRHPRRQGPLLRRLQLPRLAHRRAGRARARTRLARADRLPAVLPRVQPHGRGRSAARMRALRTRRGAVFAARARRADRQVRAGAGARIRRRAPAARTCA